MFRLPASCTRDGNMAKTPQNITLYIGTTGTLVKLEFQTHAFSKMIKATSSSNQANSCRI